MNDLTSETFTQKKISPESILQAVPDPIIVIDLKRRVLFINVSFTGMFKWQPDEILSQKIDFLLESCLAETEAAIERLKNGKNVEKIKTQLFTKDRALLNIQISLSPIPNETEPLAGIVMILKTETKLKQSQDILNSILSASPTGIGMMENFRFKWINSTAMEMFGFELSDDYEDRSIEIIFSSKIDFKHIRQESCDKLKLGQAVKFDTTFLRKDGSIFIGHLKMSAPSPNHPEERIIFTITDITWRRIAEADLTDSQQRYRGVFENTGTAMIIISENMYILMANDRFEELTGFKKSEIENKMLWTDFVAPEDLVRMQKFHNDRKAGLDVPTEYEIKLINKQKEVRDILLRVGMIQTTKQVIASLTDITSRKKMEMELTDANQALNQSLTNLKHAQAQLVESEKMAALGGLVAGVAHEINTPIGVAITAASFLEIKAKKHKDAYNEGTLSRSLFEKFMDGVSEASSIIHSNLKRAAELVNSFKQVAVDQSSEGRRKFNLKSYIDEILLSLGPKFKRTQHEIEIKCPPDLDIDSYPGAFYQIITNLLMNSLLHGFESIEAGRILFKIKLNDNRLTFTYRDNGIGMNPSQIKKIFDPFFTTKRGQGGSGLGMHIVYNLVSQTLNGEIECRSAPGQGMTCLIRIPIEPQENI